MTNDLRGSRKAMDDALWKIMQAAYLTGWAVAAPIGPVNLEIMRRVLREGLAAGIFVGLGAVCVDAGYLTLFSAGMGAFLKTEVVQRVFFFAGGALLSYLGLAAMLEARAYSGSGSLRETLANNADSSSENPGAPERDSPWKHYAVGLALTASSPMTIAFWSALSLQFVDISLGERVAASGALVAGCFSWVLTITLVVAFARRWVGPRLFAVATLAGGALVLYFGGVFLVRALALDHLLAQIMTS